MANQKLTVMKGLLLAAVLMFVVASKVTKVSSVPQVPQEVVECEISDFAMFANETMSIEERLALEPLRIPSPPPPPPTPPAENIYVLIVVDDTMKWVREFMLGHSCPWTEIEEWAHTIFEKGVQQFKYDFGIGNFYHVETKFWVTGTMGLKDEWHKAQTTFNWPDAFPDYYDCMVVMSGNIDGNKVGYAQKFGNTFIMSVKAAFLGMPVWHVFQHEASHLYGADNHTGLDGMFTFCIMSYTWLPLTRAWCDRCTEVITANKHRFG